MQLLRVDTTGVRAMATRWAAAVGELEATVAPAGHGSAGQASAVAVEAAHADVTAFTVSLAARVGTLADHVRVADAGYLANEADAADQMAALAPPVLGV